MIGTAEMEDAARAGLLELERMDAELERTRVRDPSVAARELREKEYEKYRRDPLLWSRDKLAFHSLRGRSAEALGRWLKRQPKKSHAWAREKLAAGEICLAENQLYQDRWMETVARHPQVALRTGNGVGKTAALARIIHWFLDCFPGGICVTTAGTWEQVKNRLWRELAIWKYRTRDGYIMPGKIHKTRLEISEDWYAIGLSTRDAGYFEGFHSDYLLLAYDEAKMIDETIFEAGRRNLQSAKWWRWVVASTPANPTGAFYEICGRDSWVELALSAYESEYIDLDKLAKDLREGELDEGSPLFRSMVCAEFFKAVLDALIPRELALACCGDPLDPLPGRGIGCDVARFGADKTVIMVMVDGRVVEERVVQGQDTQWTAGTIRQLAGEYRIPDGNVAVDDTAVGGGVTDALVANDIAVIAVNFGAAPMEKTKADKYRNNRTYIYGELKEAMEERRIGNVSKQAVEEVSAHDYWFLPNGKMALGSKDEVKKRLKRSPDCGDALALVVIAVGGTSGMKTPGVIRI